MQTADYCSDRHEQHGRSGPNLFLHSTLPPSPRKVRLWHIFFALPAMNGPLPAELKFRENTGVVENIKHLMTGLKGSKQLILFSRETKLSVSRGTSL